MLKKPAFIEYLRVVLWVTNLIVGATMVQKRRLVASC
jgi:hypothetical protein